MTAPHRLAIVTNDLLVGGVQRNIVAFCRHLDRSLFEPQVICVCELGPLAEELAREGTPCTLVRSIRHLGPLRLFDPWRILLLARRLRRERISVVQTRLFLGNTIGRVAAFLARTPVVVAAEHNTYVWKNRLHIALDRLLYRCTDALVCVSEAVRTFTAKQERLPLQELITLYNGIDAARFDGRRDPLWRTGELGLPQDALLVGIFGRLLPQKGIQDLLPALAELCRRIPQLYGVIVGEGPLRPELEALAARLGLEGRLRFLGLRHDVARIMGGVDVVAVPSHWEGLPTVTLEAMAMSAAVLASDIPQHREIVTDGEDGVLVDCRDAPAVARALSELLADGERRERLGRAARQKILEHFTVERMVRGYQALYLRLLEERRYAPPCSGGSPATSSLES